MSSSDAARLDLGKEDLEEEVETDTQKIDYYQDVGERFKQEHQTTNRSLNSRTQQFQNWSQMNS